MATQVNTGRERSSAYSIFILVLTLFSLVIMVALVLPLSESTIQLLVVYDSVICVVFLIDFLLNLRRSHPKSEYFIRERGWLDLLGSIPTFGFFRYTALLRLARLSRLARIARFLRGKNKTQLFQDVIRNREQYAASITALLTFLVLALSSVLVLQFESKSPNANITTGGAALWWSVVTITTVGYGDFYPVTAAGRLTGLFVMFTGVGIIGALASILASILIPSPQSEPVPDPLAQPPGELQEELAQIRSELQALRELMSR